MATQPVEIRLQLASARRQHTQPIRRPQPLRAAPAAVAKPHVEAAQPFFQVALHKARSLPRPSWLSVVLAFVAASAAMWWIMSQRLPDIDPDAVIRTNLEAARQAAAQERFLEPTDRSALNYYRTVLALDPTNAEARRGVEGISEYFVEGVKTSLVDGRIAEAVVALDGLRRTDPTHRRLPLLDAQLRTAIEERTLLQEAAAASAAASREAAQKAAAQKAAAPKAARVEKSEPSKPQSDSNVLALAAASELLANMTPALRPTTDQSGGASAPEAAPTSAAALSASATVPMDGAREEIAPAIGEASGAGPAIAPAATPPAERKLVNYVAPQYPREAQMRGIEGWIDMTLFVTPEGDVVDPRIEGGKARQLFDRAALIAVRRWKYEPQPEQNVPQRLQVRVTFELKD